MRLTTPRFSGRGSPPAIGVLSAGYRPLGSGPRAAGWSAATLCFGPSRQIVRCSHTSGVGGYADIARTVEVRLQPRHASLIGRGRRNSSGSFAMLAAIRRASPRVSKLAAVRPPGSFSFAWNKNRLIAFISASLRGQMGTLKNYQRYAARCLEQARADPDSKHRLF